MFQPWRIKVREAEVALQGGRLEEAGRLLQQPSVREFLPAKQLLAKVADELAKRARDRLAGGDSSAGWRDLDRAVDLGADVAGVSQARQEYVGQRLAEVETSLRTGSIAAAQRHLKELSRHGLENVEVRAWQAIAALVAEAQSLARQGLFVQAAEAYAQSAQVRPTVSFLAEAARECTVKARACQDLTERLHAALGAGNWRLVLERAEGLLDLCPEHRPARDARRRAWEAVGIRCAETVRPPAAPRPSPRAPKSENQAMNYVAAPQAGSSAGEQPLAPGGRFLLWVDGVGGYLVCDGPEVIVGQPVPGIQVDVPILGDISRQHCRIRRDGESYLLVPLRPVKLDGREIAGAATLVDGALIEMGQGVQLRFRRPHPLSATARLEFASRHRTQPSADGVLLMAESCVLGPGAGSHVVCRDWTKEAVLFRQGNTLRCRVSGPFSVDGCPAVDRADLGPSSQVLGEDFSFSLEQL